MAVPEVLDSVVRAPRQLLRNLGPAVPDLGLPLDDLGPLYSASVEGDEQNTAMS
jgi:hypothetical protein